MSCIQNHNLIEIGSLWMMNTQWWQTWPGQRTRWPKTGVRNCLWSNNIVLSGCRKKWKEMLCIWQMCQNLYEEGNENLIGLENYFENLEEKISQFHFNIHCINRDKWIRLQTYFSHHYGILTPLNQWCKNL
jgi:hypothetical protein